MRAAGAYYIGVVGGWEVGGIGVSEFHGSNDKRELWDMSYVFPFPTWLAFSSLFSGLSSAPPTAGFTGEFPKSSPNTDTQVSVKNHPSQKKDNDDDQDATEERRKRATVDTSHRVYKQAQRTNRSGEEP